jgi:O-antigen ligase
VIPVTESLGPRAWLSAGLLAGVTTLLGVLAGVHPSYAVGMAAVLVVTLLAFAAPVTHLTLLIALTTLVPYAIEGQYHLGGAGSGSGGLQASDLFLLTGLLRTAVVLPQLRLSRRQLIVVGLVVTVCAFTVFEAWQGLRAGRAVTEVGAEFRGLGGGFACALIAMTTLAADRGAHRRVHRALIVLGLALGLEGVLQWTLGASFSTDFGVRAGVSLTTNGVGQLQGGLFAFPIAVILSVAALASGQLRGRRQRGIVIAVLVLNAVSLLLTFERTFWVATAVAVILVGLRSGRAQRLRVLLSITLCVVIGISVLAAVSPTTLQTAEQRLLSIGQYQTDNSVRYRAVESGFVLAKIRAKPLLGWGLGDTIWWGQPWEQVPPSAQSYTHVGYLWLFWREGLLGGGVVLFLLALSAVWPGKARAGRLVTAIRTGCQASILALFIVDFTFPAFHQGSQITYVMGFLIAYCAVPVVARRRRAATRGGGDVVAAAALARA